MKSIDTQIGTLKVDEGLPTIEEIGANLAVDTFTDALTDDMNVVKGRILNKTIKLAKVFFVSTADLSAMLSNNTAEILIFYQTDGGDNSTFTVISAGKGLNPQLTSGNKKWKLKVSLADNWKTGPVTPTYPDFGSSDINSIYNPLLPAYSHKLESATQFFDDLKENSKNLLAAIDAGSLPNLRIAVALKDDLKVFTDASKYKGILIYLNAAAEDRIVEVQGAPIRQRFVSLSIVGVVEDGNLDWEPLATKNEEKITLRGFCPPDCPIYNNN